MKCSASLDGPALALVLEAPVRLGLRRAREVEIEVRREPRRARGAREHDPQHVGVLVVVGERRGSAAARRAPAARTTSRHTATRRPQRPRRARSARARRAGRARARTGCARRLDAHQQAVERRDVDADRVEAALERLDERRPRAGERIEHAPARAGRDGGRAPRRAAGCTCRDTDAGGGRASCARRSRQVALRPRRGRGRALRRSAPASTPTRAGSRTRRDGLLLRRRSGTCSSARRARRSGRSGPRARAAPGGAASQASAAAPRAGAPSPRRPSRAGRRTPSPLFDLTSQKTSVRPRRDDQVELAAGEPAVRVEDPVAAEPVPARGAALGVRAYAARRRGSSSRQVGTRPPRAAVDLARPALAHDLRVRRSDVADVRARSRSPGRARRRRACSGRASPWRRSTPRRSPRSSCRRRRSRGAAGRSARA